MSSRTSAASVAQLHLKIGQLTADRNRDLREIDDQIRDLQRKISGLEYKKEQVAGKYDPKLEALKRQLHNRTAKATGLPTIPRSRVVAPRRADAVFREFQVAVADLDRVSGGGVAEADVIEEGTLGVLVKELKAVSQSGRPDPRVDLVREHVYFAPGRRGGVEIAVKNSLGLYDEWLDLVSPAQSSQYRSSSRSPSPPRRSPSYYDSYGPMSARQAPMPARQAPEDDPFSVLDDLL